MNIRTDDGPTATDEQLVGMWEHVLGGGSAAVVGVGALPVPTSWAPLVVRVRCDHHTGPLAPILEARRAILRILGGSPDEVDEATQSKPMALRLRLLGEAPEASRDGFTETCNRLQREAEHGAVLIFEAVDAADEATVAVLRRALAGKERLQLPVVLAFRSASPNAAGALLIDALRAVGGLVVSLDEVARHAATPNGPSLGALRAQTLQVLRTGALLGDEFDAREVATLLDLTELDVLEELQAAVDGGFTLDDRGGMRFHLPATLARELRASLLPSLAAARRAQARAARRLEVPDVEETVARSAPATTPGLEEDDDEDEAGPPGWLAPPTSVLPGGDEARRANPVESRVVAGDADGERLAERHLASVRTAEALGAPTQAIRAAAQALAAVEGPPHTPARRRLRARILTEIGRITWLGAGAEYDFSLATALEALSSASQMLDAGDPADLRAHIASLIANVCYDIGDRGSLERALRVLDDAAQLLRDAGDVRGMTRLLNDQAAILVRMGDLPAALRILQVSRAAFASRLDGDPVALAELAETDHLLARLPLHAPPRPGEDSRELEGALAAAHAAEGAFRRLRASRELARVWETIGRLELRRGHIDRALEHLRAAGHTQEVGGDAVGLARTTGAMAEALEAAGDHRGALARLGDSVRLNLVKGSPLGLAFNRQSLEALRASSSHDAESAELLGQVARRLAEAESALGAAPRIDRAELGAR